jgi:hypothetical protein
MESMGSHGIYEYPWNPRVPMESTGAHGIHEKRGGGRDMGSVVARGLGGSGRVRGLRKGKREEVGWDGVRQLGGVRAGAVEWSSGGYPSILECIPHVLEYPNILECILIEWGTQVYGNASP